VRYDYDTETLAQWELLRAQLRRRRIDLGITQRELSALMGKRDDYVSYLENSRRSTNLHSLFKWCTALRMNVILDEMD
jgi:transcriptional regulator with XRE-family HTH domain